MNFAGLSERFFSAPGPVKSAATLEFRVSSGAPIAPGVRSADESTLMRADGRIEYRRRGDFGERGDCPPGAWISQSDPERVNAIWDKLGEIGPDSFPSRVADPGDGIRYLTACVPDQVESLAIGPADPSQPLPGQVFLDELYPVLGQPENGECLWAVRMSWEGIIAKAGGAELTLRFANPGIRPIGLVFDGVTGASDFAFRYAQDRDEIPYPEWHQAASVPAPSDGLRFHILQPGDGIVRTVFFPCTFPDRGKYMGAITYRQTSFIDVLAGHPVMTGMAFTSITEFVL